MKNINQMLKQAQEIQNQMAAFQGKLEHIEMTGTSAGGMVTLTVNGKNDVKGLKIDPSLIDPKEPYMLEDLIVAAFNDAKSKIEAHVSEEMAKLTGGMKLPAGMGLPF